MYMKSIQYNRGGRIGHGRRQPLLKFLLFSLPCHILGSPNPTGAHSVHRGHTEAESPDLVALKQPYHTVIVSNGTAQLPLLRTGFTTQQKRLKISTTSGTYLGFTNYSTVHPVDTWLGIPYAQPPTGKLRFRAPVLYDKPPQTGRIRPALRFGNACPQIVSWKLGVPISEDCLSLNIYRPANESQSQQAPLPILVWIHGGALTYGTSAASDGNIIVSSSVDSEKPLIFVSINYRLNSFGFLNTDDLPTEDLQVGLKDQIASLSWLKLNIQHFGGDPNKITIWGQSAGAFSVALLMTYLPQPATPGAALFRAAIMDSGSPTTHTVPAVNVYDREGLPYHVLLNVTGCNCVPTELQPNSAVGCGSKVERLECLRELSSDDLSLATQVVATKFFTRQISVWGPSHKLGSIIDERPSKRLAEKRFLRIPVMMGTNKDEGTLSAVGAAKAYDNTTQTSNEYFYSYMTNSSILDQTVIDPNVFRRVAELYPDDPSAGSPFDTGYLTLGQPPIFKRLAAWFGDLHYAAPRRLWARQTSQVESTFVYYFDGPAKSTDPIYGGVSHSSELPLIFGSIDYANMTEAEITATDRLAHKMRNHYINFVHELHPGSDWPAYTATGKTVMRFNKLKMEDDLIKDDWRAVDFDYLNSQPALDTYLT